jgi:hypothetical protein
MGQSLSQHLPCGVVGHLNANGQHNQHCLLAISRNTLNHQMIILERECILKTVFNLIRDLRQLSFSKHH